MTALVGFVIGVPVGVVLAVCAFAVLSNAEEQE